MASPKERKAEGALGDKVAVRTHGADLADGVIAAKARGGQPPAAVGGADGLVLDGLILQVLVVLAVSVSDGQDFFRGFGGQFAIGSRISERDLLAGVDADFALEQDESFLEGILGDDKRLLLRQKLDARAQFIQIGGSAGLVSRVNVGKEHLIRRLERFGVIHLA